VIILYSGIDVNFYWYQRDYCWHLRIYWGYIIIIIKSVEILRNEIMLAFVRYIGFVKPLCYLYKLFIDML